MPETQKIKETEDWLRDHPDADWKIRFDMIKRLSELKSKTKEQNENHKAKILR